MSCVPKHIVRCCVVMCTHFMYANQHFLQKYIKAWNFGSLVCHTSHVCQQTLPLRLIWNEMWSLMCVIHLIFPNMQFHWGWFGMRCGFSCVSHISLGVGPRFTRVLFSSFSWVLFPSFSRVFFPSFTRVVFPSFSWMLFPLISRVFSPSFSRVLFPSFSRECCSP